MRETRPRPVASFLGWVFTPVVSIWGFIGMIPNLVYLGFGLVVVLVFVIVAWLCLQFFKFVFRR
ncbi:hypothetical protein [Schlesneria paludicola]|uniref:hypothetical protein n=1 Tax=Schlesneria paludicola TaxID=360056 RepID=UPI00059034F0|nr:hypothetical protein [Schlesneria paludicola]